MLDIINERLPRHIAFIVDGNGRWASMRKKSRTQGHKAGVKTVENIINYAKNLKIEICSFFVFSTENWKRPKEEIDAIMKMLKDFIKRNKSKFEKNNLRLSTMGDLTKLDKNIVAEIEETKQITEKNTGMIVNICINYGGRADIVCAVNNILKSGVKTIDEKTFSAYLFSQSLPDPDLIIRTSGEYRISNFMLWQSAYAEFYFTKTLWPDFDGEELEKAIYEYEHRERRFGKVIKK